MRNTVPLVALQCLLLAGAVHCSRERKEAPAEPQPAAQASRAEVAPAGPSFESGSRLRARLRDGGDGALILVGWKDTTLGVACTLQTIAGGEVRCIPAPDDVIGYSDAACTQKVLAEGPCSTSASFAVEQDPGDACSDAPPVMHVYTRGPSAGAGHIHFKQPDGTCVDGGDRGGLYTATPIAIDQLARATSTLEPHGGIQVEVLHGDDGSMQLGALHDPGDGATCSPVSLANDQVECISRVRGTWRGPFPLYSDPGCAKPLLNIDTPPCSPPSIVVKASGDACSYEQSLFAIDSPAQVSSAYEVGGFGQSCTRATPPPGAFTNLYKLMPIAAGGHPALAEAQGNGSGRLRARYLTTPSGEQVSAPGALHDTQWNMDCYAQSIGGRIYCLPSVLTPMPATFFSDVTCTRALVEPLPSGCSALPPIVEIAQAAAAPTCPADLPSGGALYKVGARFTGTRVYQSFGGGLCTATQSPGELYTLGAAVQPGTYFPELTDIVE